MVKRAQHGGEEKLRYITLSQSFLLSPTKKRKDIIQFLTLIADIDYNLKDIVYFHRAKSNT